MYPAVFLVVRICIRVSLPLSAEVVNLPKRPVLGPEVTVRTFLSRPCPQLQRQDGQAQVDEQAVTAVLGHFGQHLRMA